MIGIYKILNKTNGKIYIGQSVNIERRWKEHLYDYKNENEKRNYNMKIHRAMRKYGIDNFVFEVIEECEKEELDEREIYWIDFLETQNKEKGYNLTSGGAANRTLAGEAHSQAKVTQEEVNLIKSYLKNNLTFSEIEEKINYKISKPMICNINTGKNWFDPNETYPLRTEKTDQSGENNPRAKLTKEKVMLMRKEYSELKSPKDILKKYSKLWNISERTLRAALYGESWKKLPIWNNAKQEWI